MTGRQKFDMVNLIIWFVLAVCITGPLQLVAFLGLVIVFVIQMRGLRPKQEAHAPKKTQGQELNERFARDVAVSERIMANESLTPEARIEMVQAMLLGGTRYGHLSPSGLRTDSDCPPHLRAIRRPGGGYF